MTAYVSLKHNKHKTSRIYPSFFFIEISEQMDKLQKETDNTRLPTLQYNQWRNHIQHIK